MSDLPRVLCVDDEPNVLEGLGRILDGDYDVTTRTSAAAALDLMAKEQFVVVISDMRMPEIDGATFLARVRETAPDTVRMLLTGQSDLNAAIAAVNHGQIFRFLQKPCPVSDLIAAVEAAVEQHRLVTSERVLLEQTLQGSIKAMLETLALASPAAFGRANRFKDVVGELLSHHGAQNRWPIEIAAMLSQVPMITLPPETLEKVYAGLALTPNEQLMVDGFPGIAERLFASIPRLEPVVEILRYTGKHYDGGGRPAERLSGEQIPYGARLLKLVFDAEILSSRSMPPAVVFDTLRARTGWYDPKLLEAFAEVRVKRREPVEEVKELPLREIGVGMKIAESIKTLTGVVVISRGHEVTRGLIERLNNFAVGGGIQEPIRVLVRAGRSQASH